MGEAGPQTPSGMLDSRQCLKMSLQGENIPEGSWSHFPLGKECGMRSFLSGKPHRMLGDIWEQPGPAAFPSPSSCCGSSSLPAPPAVSCPGLC